MDADVTRVGIQRVNADRAATVLTCRAVVARVTLAAVDAVGVPNAVDLRGVASGQLRAMGRSGDRDGFVNEKASEARSAQPEAVTQSKEAGEAKRSEGRASSGRTDSPTPWCPSVPTSRIDSQVPCPLQSFGQVVRWQALPS